MKLLALIFRNLDFIANQAPSMITAIHLYFEFSGYSHDLLRNPLLKYSRFILLF